MNFGTIAAYLVCACIWGTTWYAIRICIQPQGYPTYTGAAVRFTVAAALLGTMWLVQHRRIVRQVSWDKFWILVAGMLAGVAYGLLYASEERVTGGMAAVISATGPLMAAVLAMVTSTERLSKGTAFGLLASFVGVLIVFHDRMLFSAAQASAVIVLLLVNFLTASSNVVMKSKGHDVSVIVSSIIYCAGAAVTLWIMAMLFDSREIPQPLPVEPTVALAYLSVAGTLIAFASYFYLLKRVRLSTAMTLAFVTPLIALIVDAMFERQAAMTWENQLGTAIVLGGVFVNVVMQRRREKVPAES